MHMYSQSFIHLFIYSFIHVCIYSFIHLFIMYLLIVIPHITVWGSCFSLGTRRCFRIPPRRFPHLTHHLSHLTHHTTTHHSTPSHTSVITALLITPLVTATSSHNIHHSTTYHTTCHSNLIAAGCLEELLRVSCGRRSTQGLLEKLLRAWSPPGPRLPFVWQGQYTGPAGGAAAQVVAPGREKSGDREG